MNPEEGLAWQAGIWDRMSEVYRQELDPRLAPVVTHHRGQVRVAWELGRLRIDR